MGWSDLMERVEAEKVERQRLALKGAVDKNPAMAWTLWLVLGWLGGHRFYLQKRGWLMLAWFVFAGLILSAILPGDTAGPMVWFIGAVCWWVADAFFIPQWIRDFQATYAEATQELEAADMAEALTLPLLRAAQKHGGTLTVTQGVLATGLPFTDVERCLTELSRTGYVEIQNTDDGNLLFAFGDLPEWDSQEQAEIELAEANALALADAAEALELEAELLEEAEKRAHRRSTGSSVVRGAVAGLTAFGLNAIFDDDDE